MNAHKVNVDGMDYIPVGQFGLDADETSKAIIRMLISGQYVEPTCHKDGRIIDEISKCDCSGCRSYNLAVQFLGGVPKCESDPIIETLLANIKRA